MEEWYGNSCPFCLPALTIIPRSSMIPPNKVQLIPHGWSVEEMQKLQRIWRREGGREYNIIYQSMRIDYGCGLAAEDGCKGTLAKPNNKLKALFQQFFRKRERAVHKKIVASANRSSSRERESVVVIGQTRRASEPHTWTTVNVFLRSQKNSNNNLGR